MGGGATHFWVTRVGNVDGYWGKYPTFMVKRKYVSFGGDPYSIPYETVHSESTLGYFAQILDEDEFDAVASLAVGLTRIGESAVYDPEPRHFAP